MTCCWRRALGHNQGHGVPWLRIEYPRPRFRKKSIRCVVDPTYSHSLNPSDPWVLNVVRGKTTPMKPGLTNQGSISISLAEVLVEIRIATRLLVIPGCQRFAGDLQVLLPLPEHPHKFRSLTNKVFDHPRTFGLAQAVDPGPIHPVERESLDRDLFPGRVADHDIEPGPLAGEHLRKS